MVTAFVRRFWERLAAKLPGRRSRSVSMPVVAEMLEIRRVLSTNAVTPAASTAVVTVNATSNVHAINPNIYGAAYATTAQLADLNLSLNREGGNSANTYNWQQDATNHANDWYFESIADGTGNGQSKDAFVSQTKSGGAQADLTIPIVPYVASLGPNRSILGSYPVSVYGPQQSTDPYDPAFGNGVTPSGQNITDTNPLSNYVANSPAFEQAWIQHLLTTFGTPANGGVQYFTLGNEPGLWNSTNRDLHPNGETNTELLNDIINYGSMIKSIDPNAQILAGEEWGWTNYFVDGADAAAGNYGATYNGLNVQQWLLQQLDQYQTQHGIRLLNDYTLHYYPQENGVDSNSVDSATELLRNQVTRSLWDSTYVDPSWIGTTGINGGKIDLIPTMQSWVNQYYPGTKTGISEYNFGAEGDMNGATTQADVYGIFGQQGLDLATRWTTPATGSPAYLAMKLWRNYDGKDSGFGNTSVGTSVGNPDQTDAFAATRSSDGALTVAVINKNLYNSNNPTATTQVTINLNGVTANGVAQDWQLAAINPNNQTSAAITNLANVHFTGNSFTVNVPMESVSMFVIEPATTVNHAPQGTPNTVTLLENSSYTFKSADFGFSDPHDTPPNTFLAVEMTTLPLVGGLTDNGAAVTAGEHVSVTDITGGKLKFTPVAYKYGSNYASLTFQVQDNGGTANGGVDTDPTPRKMTIFVNPVNDAPQGTPNTITMLENKSYTFKSADFGFSDPHDTPPNTFLAVEMTILPLVGSLTDNGVAVTAGAHVSVTDITSGKLKFTPVAYKYGSNYASFTFQVQDNGGTANGGVDTDPTPRKMTLFVSPVNDAPQGTPNTVTMLENKSYTFKSSDFGFGDPHDTPPNAFLAVELTTLPVVGSLTDNGAAVTAGEHVSVTDITAGKLKFTPVAYKYGSNYASFTFQVQDNGGTANGGVDTDPTPRKMTLFVSPVNDAPLGTANTVTMVRNTSYTFKSADFGFSDPHDTPPNTFLAVKITTLPLVGTLTDNGVAVTVGEYISVTDITASKLKFTPVANKYGSNYASFLFQVQDNGGTANGGIDTDPNPKKMTINVT